MPLFAKRRCSDGAGGDQENACRFVVFADRENLLSRNTVRVVLNMWAGGVRDDPERLSQTGP